MLTYSLFPATGEQFLKWKYGVEPIPESVKPPPAAAEAEAK